MRNKTKILAFAGSLRKDSYSKRVVQTAIRGAEPEGLPTLTIAERMIERTPGITRMIDRLEAKGLVVREIRPADRRCVHCRITEKGLNLLELLDAPVEEANQAAFRGLNEREIEQITELLEKTREAHEGE